MLSAYMALIISERLIFEHQGCFVHQFPIPCAQFRHNSVRPLQSVGRSPLVLGVSCFLWFLPPSICMFQLLLLRMTLSALSEL